MEGPPLGPGGEDITWPDQVVPRCRKASSTRKIKPQTSNLETACSRVCLESSEVLMHISTIGGSVLQSESNRLCSHKARRRVDNDLHLRQVLVKHLGGGQPPSLPWHARPHVLTPLLSLLLIRDAAEALAASPLAACCG